MTTSFTFDLSGDYCHKTPKRYLFQICENSALVEVFVKLNEGSMMLIQMVDSKGIAGSVRFAV